MENALQFVPQLTGSFRYAMRIPSYYFLVVFFLLFTLTTEKIMYWFGVSYKDKKEHKKIEEEKKMLFKKR